MKLNINNIFYFCFRMLPFLLVSYFFIMATFLQDMNSLLFLIGLALATLAAYCSTHAFSIFSNKGMPSIRSVCHVIPLFDSGPISKLPLSTVLYTYTLCYFSLPIMYYGRQSTNLPILVVFPIIAFLDMMWIYNFGCASAWNIIGAGVVGMTVGFIWSLLLFYSNLRQVQYFGILSTEETCNLPSKMNYACSLPTDKSTPNSPSATSPAPSRSPATVYSPPNAQSTPVYNETKKSVSNMTPYIYDTYETNLTRAAFS